MRAHRARPPLEHQPWWEMAARQLTDLDDLRGASPDELAAALRPALRALVTGTSTATGAD